MSVSSDSVSSMAVTGTCAPCSDSPLSQTASIVGILTFANSLILGLLFFLSSTGRQILDSPADVRELLAATEAQFDELRDGQAWLEAEVAAGRMLDERKSLELQGPKGSDEGDREKGTDSSGENTAGDNSASTVANQTDTVGKSGNSNDTEKLSDCDSNTEPPRRNALDGSSPSTARRIQYPDGVNFSPSRTSDNAIAAAATYAQATRLLDRAQLCFIASQRYLERYGRIVDDESGEAGSGDGDLGGGPLLQHVFRRASFVAAKQDVVRSTEVRAKALNDFRRFRNRVMERQAQRDRDMLHEQSLALQEVLRILKEDFPWNHQSYSRFDAR